MESSLMQIAVFLEEVDFKNVSLNTIQSPLNAVNNFM